MSNHAYKSTATLRPSSNGPTPIGALCERFSLALVSAKDAVALNDLNILGVNVDSTDTAPGELFVGLPGFTVHDTRFTADAIASSATVVLTGADGAQVVHQTAPSTPVLVHSDSRAVVSPLNAGVCHHPARGLATTVVTGTSGKTTTAYFLDAILSTRVGDCMMVGTVELHVREHSVEPLCTTVEAPVLQRMTALAVEGKVGTTSLKAPSHTIILHRLNGVVVNVTGFTNLQRDHLNFHKATGGYLEAKAQLFTPEHTRRDVVYVGDQWGVALTAKAPIKIDHVHAYLGETPADWWIGDTAVSLTDSATTFVLHGPDGEKIRASCPLPGLVNMQNAALALVMTTRAGVPTTTAAMTLADTHNIPGRMQRISQRDGRCGLRIVGFARTPDAMELTLKAVRPITPGRLIVVFSSDDGRDQGKRPMLGEVCIRLADILVVIDKNPRSENPQLIRNAILEEVRGVRPSLTDAEGITTWRGGTVRRGVELYGPDDTVIVAGKGHEPFLEMVGEFIRYNDAPIMVEAVEEKQGRT